MEIQAKLSFKHGRIMRIVDSAGISIKELSKMCGWKYQNLLNFVSFKRLPKCEDHDSLLCALQSIDPTVTESDVFPELYNRVKGALHTRVSVRDIPLENLLPCNPDMFAIEDRAENRVALKLDAEKALSEMRCILSHREMLILNMYFGVGHKEPHSLEEIGKELRLTRERVRMIRECALDKLARHSEMQKYKGIGALEIEEGQFTAYNSAVIPLFKAATA